MFNFKDELSRYQPIMEIDQIEDALQPSQMQDLLDLGAEARMNFPGTLSDSNWTWRAKDGIMTDVLAKRIKKLTKLYDRLGGNK